MNNKKVGIIIGVLLIISVLLAVLYHPDSEKSDIDGTKDTLVSGNDIQKEDKTEIEIKTTDMLPDDMTELPDFTNYMLDDAASYLSEKEIGTKIKYVYDNELPDGLIVGQDTPAGETAQEVTMVAITVNINQEEIDNRAEIEDIDTAVIPDLTSYFLDEAIAKLSENDLSFEIKISTKEEEYDRRKSTGMILSYTLNHEEENPNAVLPTETVKGDTVTLYIYAPQPETAE